MDGADPLQQRGIGNCPYRRLAAGPGVAPGLRYAEHTGHGDDREVGLVGAHELEAPDGRPRSPARTKPPRARGCHAPVSVAGSDAAAGQTRRTRSPSGCGRPSAAWPRGGPRCGQPPRPISGWSGATARISGPKSVGSRPARTRSTICRRNSAGYAGRVLGIGKTPHAKAVSVPNKPALSQVALNDSAGSSEAASTSKTGLLRLRFTQAMDLPRQHHARGHQGCVQELKEKRPVLHRLNLADLAVPELREAVATNGPTPTMAR